MQGWQHCYSSYGVIDSHFADDGLNSLGCYLSLG